MADGATITSIKFDDGTTFKQGLTELQKAIFAGAAIGITKVLDVVGKVATTKFMIRGSADLRITHPTKLTHRSFRLGDSLTINFSTTQKGIPFSKKVRLRKFEGAGGRSGKAEGFRIITFNKVKGFHGEIGTDVPYAEFHEFGTARLPERAFVNPAMQDVVNRIAANIIEQEMGRAIKKEGW